MRSFHDWTDQEIGWAFLRAIGRNAMNFLVSAIVYAFVWWAGRISMFMELIDENQRITGMVFVLFILTFRLGMCAKKGGRWLTKD